MNYTASSETITISDYSKKCNERRVQKPYLQRKKQWAGERDGAFIRFLIRVRNAVMQFVFNKRIIDGREIWFVWDGNNRSNAIIEFIKAPLKLLQELLPQEYPPDMKQRLSEQSLNKILDYDNFGEFCDEFGFRDWYNQRSAKEAGAAFKTLRDELRHIDFLNIKLPITIFDGADDEYMVGIYTDVNQAGEPISMQDVIAAKVFNITYKPIELERYNTIKSHVDDYYNNVDEALMVNLDGCNTAVSMNLYQVLYGFQAYLSKLHPKLVEPPGKCKATTLDIIFELYRSLTQTDFERIDDLNSFLKKIEHGVSIIADIRERVLSATIILNKECSSIDAFLANNALMILVSYIYREYNHVDELNSVLLRIVIYKLLCDCIEDKIEKTKCNQYNCICPSITKLGIASKIKAILNNSSSFTIVTKEQVIELLHKINKERSLMETEHVRQKISKFQIMIMSLYYNKRVPRDLIGAKRDLDHIIPFSCAKDISGININRLGNLMLIESTINKKKGNKQLLDKFISEHHLGYYNYPNEKEYAAICSGGTIRDCERYNAMCERRELAFFSVIEGLI